MTPREAALAVWQAGLAAAAVNPLVHAALRRDESILRIGSLRLDLAHGRRLLVLGCGKAGAAMARAVEEIVGDRIDNGFVVVKDGGTAPTQTVRLAEASHPVPDSRGQAAAMRLLELAAGATADDLILVLLSGGGSALTPAPPPPITLEEKQTVTRSLLAAGATIDEINTVRKHLSLLKGGQLARVAAPAQVVTLVLSDVIGDRLDVIASGPTAPDPTTFADALAVLTNRGILDELPGSVRQRLERGVRGQIEETPKPGDPLFARVTSTIIGNNSIVVSAAAAQAERLGYRADILTRELAGEAREVATEFVARVRRLDAPACLIAGGETTVTVRGQGRGGRCQEFALAAALALKPGEDLAVLAAGTDGTDGPTEAAGAVVDGDTIGHSRDAGVDAVAALAENNAYVCLRAGGDLVLTGPTNTNLLDLYIAVHGSARPLSEAL